MLILCFLGACVHSTYDISSSLTPVFPAKSGFYYRPSDGKESRVRKLDDRYKVGDDVYMRFFRIPELPGHSDYIIQTFQEKNDFLYSIASVMDDEIRSYVFDDPARWPEHVRNLVTQVRKGKEKGVRLNDTKFDFGVNVKDEARDTLYVLRELARAHPRPTAGNTIRRLPQFTDYPSLPIGEDDLRRGKLRPNFAGRYVLTTKDCGPECKTGTVTDITTGTISSIPFTICCWGEVDKNFRPIEFRSDSRLIVFSGLRDEAGENAAHFYEFRDEQFFFLQGRRKPGLREPQSLPEPALQEPEKIPLSSRLDRCSNAFATKQDAADIPLDANLEGFRTWCMEQPDPIIDEMSKPLTVPERSTTRERAEQAHKVELPPAYDLQPYPETAHLSASDTRRLWRFVMTRFYGPYDNEHKCWKDARHNICMRPHKLDVIKSGDHLQYYVVFKNAEYLSEICRSCRGKIGLLILSNAAGRLRVLARNSLREEFSFQGTLPPAENFSLRLLGPNGNYGWVVEDGYIGSGQFAAIYTVFGRVQGALVSFGDLPRGQDHRGIGAPGCNVKAPSDVTLVRPETCYDFELLFDRSRGGAAAVYPVLLKGSGTLNGAPFERTFKIEFDPQLRKYVLPSELSDVWGNN